MDFIIRLPRTSKQCDVIMVVLNKLSKTIDVILVKYTFKEIDIAWIFMKDIFKLHGMPKKILSNQMPILPLIFRNLYFWDLEPAYISTQHTTLIVMDR